MILSAILLISSGCAPVTRAVVGTVGMASRTVGVAGRAAVGVVPLAAGLLPTKLFFSCIPEGTPIDTPDGPCSIEMIRPGDKVVGFDGSPVRVLQKHGYSEDPASNRFFRITFENRAEIELCDMHRIGGIRAKDLTPGDRIGDQIVQSIEAFDGVERSYDLLTEDVGYRISGIPVNSMIEEMVAASRDGLETVRKD